MKKKGILLFSVLLLGAPSTTIAINGKGSDSSEISEFNTSETVETQSSIENSQSSEEQPNETTTDSSTSEEKTKEELYKEIEKLALTAQTPEEQEKVLQYIKENTDYASSGPFSGMMSRASRRMGVAEYMGTTKARLLNELQSHERDNFYIGTPFRSVFVPSEQNLSPNGAPNRFGPGMNCTGFVATAFRRAGGDLGQITRVANAWGDVANAYNWRDALSRNTEYYEFNSVAALLSSGKAEKGDILYFEPNYSIPGYDPHIGFFWGSTSSENKMWHSYDQNRISNIKAARPWTKIVLFKLGENKNDIISQKNMNAQRFINTNGAYVYSRPYQSGDGRKTTTNGLSGKQVTVTKQVENGHGVWQEFTYNESGRTVTGWVKSNELSDYINKVNYSTKLILKGNTSYVYAQPYYPGVSTLNILRNLQHTSVTITQKATTGYGEWYYGTTVVNGRRISGWMKSTDFIKQTSSTPVNQKFVVTQRNGSIYDTPYISNTETKWIGNTQKIYQQSLLFTEKVTTGYGEWYKTTLSDGKSGWIKSTDLGFYQDYETVKGKSYLNRNYAIVYNEPYRGSQTKQVTKLNDMENVVINYTEKATTAYGTWYKSSLIRNGKTVNGWIKSTDLSSQYRSTKLNETRKLTNVTNGVIYDSPYNDGYTKRIGETRKVSNQAIKFTESVKTPKGLWYKGIFNVSGSQITGWVKSTDVSSYTGYENKSGNFYINKNYGDVFSEPYNGKGTKKVNNLNNMKNVPFSYNEKAVTKYGTWYKGTFNKNGKNISGWVKSVDLDNQYSYTKESKTYQITNKNGWIYDSPYNVGYSKRIGVVPELKTNEVTVSKSVKTPSGTWYEAEFDFKDRKETGWIKLNDLSAYDGNQQTKGTFVINKNYGSVYNEPYKGKSTKKVDDLNDMQNVVYTYTQKAVTSYGTWYKGSFIRNGMTISGWVKSVDLSNDYISKKESGKRQITNKNGWIYDTPHNSGQSKRIAVVPNLETTEIEVLRSAKTKSGNWFEFHLNIDGKQTTGWIKSTDLK